MGDLIDLGPIYWSENTASEETEELIEEIKYRLEENESLKRQLILAKKQLANREPIKITEIKPVEKPKVISKNKKPKTVKVIKNLELDKSFWQVPRQLKDIRKNLNKLEILILDHLFDKLHAWKKEYGLFTISELAREFETNRTRVRISLKKLEKCQIILNLNRDNLGKIIFFNTDSNRLLIENIESGKLSLEIIHKTWLNDKPLDTNCTHPLSTKQTTGWKQNEPWGEYNTIQLNQVQNIENTDNTEILKNNQSKNNIKKNIQSNQKMNSEMIKENIDFISDQEKYQSLKNSLKKRKLNPRKLNELIGEYSLNQVYFCFKDLEEKEKHGVKITNLAGLLINSLKDFDCSEDLEKEGKIIELENQNLFLQDKNLKYLKIFQCLEPTKIKITDWQKDLIDFTYGLLSKFHLTTKSVEERIEIYFKDLGIDSQEKKKQMTDNVKSWIQMENESFSNILKQLKSLINESNLEKLLLEAFKDNLDLKTENLITKFIVHIEKI